MQHPPPCCASCPELTLQTRACRLLSDPTVENRLRMVTMPCDVRRLVRLRMRAHGDDVVSEALARWEAADITAETLSMQRQGSPLDARLWLSSWPVSVLAKRAIEARAGAGKPVPGAGEPLVLHDAPIYRALHELYRIDPAGFALIAERCRGSFDPVGWRASFGDSDAALANRFALALYRVLVTRADVLPNITDARQRASLLAVRFRAGDDSDFAGLSAARAALGDPSLTIVELRALEQKGAEASLELLRGHPTIGVVLSPAALTAFRRALRLEQPRLDADPPSQRERDEAYDGAIFALLDRELRATPPRTRDAHPTPVAMAAFAAGESPPEAAPSFVEHLLACNDERCNQVFRAEASGREMVRRALASPMSEPPPAFPGVAMGAASPHMIKCRDVLWETFNAMAVDEGRDVDDLVEEAMDRYRALRAHVREAAGPPSSFSGTPASEAAAPSTRRSSAPPPSTRAGLRLSAKSAPPREPGAESPVQPSQRTLEAPTTRMAAAERPSAEPAEETTEVTKKR